MRRKCTKSEEILKIATFFWRGGEKFYGQTICGHLGDSENNESRVTVSKKTPPQAGSFLGGRFGYFCSAWGEGECEAPGGGGGRLFVEHPRRGGVSRAGEGLGGCLRGIFGGE